MAYETKDNSGVLFANDKKEPGSNQPDRKGRVRIAGVDYWQSAWIKKDKNGAQYLSQSFEPMEKGTKPAARRPIKDDMADEIPF